MSGDRHGDQYEYTGILVLENDKLTACLEPVRPLFVLIQILSSIVLMAALSPVQVEETLEFPKFRVVAADRASNKSNKFGNFLRGLPWRGKLCLSFLASSRQRGAINESMYADVLVLILTLMYQVYIQQLFTYVRYIRWWGLRFKRGGSQLHLLMVY